MKVYYDYIVTAFHWSDESPDSFAVVCKSETCRGAIMSEMVELFNKYKPGSFGEYHTLYTAVASNDKEAIRIAKTKHYGR